MKLLRIFISSPGDVIPERRRAALVIEKLAKDYARFFEVKPYLWETEPMLASGTFQDAIVPPGETDILVLILWARLGTPLPERTQSQEYRGIDGRAPVTGTEWEFETALAAHRQRGVPDLLAYKKKASPKAEYRSEADLDELRRQLHKLEAFWSRHFVDRGEFRAAFGEFEDLDGFEAKLEGDLRRLIKRCIAKRHGEADKVAGATWLTGSPFRGLETYRFEHAPIFFGRSEATKTAVEHLVENAEAARPFLLVLGASGAGKSSLAQAGIVPALGVRGVVAGVGEWRRAVMRPAGHPGGPFMALAAGLAGDDAVPELLKGQDVAALARHLETAAAEPGFPIVSALAAREQDARQKGDLLSFEEVRLILVVDQLEELFTFGEVTPDQRRAFVLCVKGLMDSRRVFVVATMRSDYWHRAAEVPLLVALAEGHGRLDLLPPTQGEITEMIRRPAEVARLSFETDPRTEVGLDAALAEEASREPGALPLLSFLLDALYVQDVQESQGSTLRYASMRSLRGLKGAIATRAEAAFAALPADAQAALPKVLRALVTVSRSGAEPTARAIPMARFAEDSPERRVVEAFLDPQMRLLVADGDGDGARVRLAHEALITHWERAKRQIAQDRDDLRTRAVVEEAEAEWRAAAARNKRGYLLRDPHLANALDLAKRWKDEFDTETLNFIQASQQRARLLQRLVAAAAAVLALATIAASALGWLAYRAQQTATGERNQALITQSRFLADQARQQLAKFDPGTAMALAIEALSDSPVSPRPYVAEAEIQLEEAWHALRERIVIADRESEVSSAAFSPDGKCIVTASGRTARLWDAETGKPVGVPLAGHKGFVSSAVFSSNGKRIVTASWDRTARLWDAETGKPIGVPLMLDSSAAFSPDGKRIATAAGETARLRDAETDEPTGMPLTDFFGVVSSAVFSLNGKRIVTASGETARLWDAETGKSIGEPLADHEGVVSSAVFSPDGKRIVTASGETARLWDAETGKPIGVPLTGHKDAVLSAAFSPDSKRVVTASDDATAWLWDAETGKPIGVPLTGHEDAVLSAAFSPDGKRIVTASEDKTARLWDAETGQPINVPLTGHEKAVLSAAFSPDGKRIVTASEDKKARLWDAETGKPIDMPLTGHEGIVFSAAFSPDGKHIITASWDKTARLWNAETRRPFGVPLTGHENAVLSAAFSPDGKRIVTASSDKTARLWDGEIGKPISVLTGHEARVFSAVFSPDGKRIVTASLDKTARLWDAETGTPRGVPLAGHESFVFSAVFSPDGKRIATASEDKTARLWDAETGKPIGVPLTGHEGVVSSAVFSPDGKRIVTASWDKTARLWDAETGKPIGVPLTGHEMLLSSAAFSPDGKLIVTASWDNTARLWNAETGNPIGLPLTGHRLFVSTAAFSPDGKRIVTASWDNTARLWDAETGKPSGVPLTGHEDHLSSAAFSPDGKRVITTSWDKTARLWDAETGKPLSVPLGGHDDHVSSAAFSPDGKRVITTSKDKTARLWEIFANVQESVAHAKPTVARCLTHKQRVAAFLDPEPPSWCIELDRWPYHTQEWKDWLKHNRTNESPPMPETPEMYRFHVRKKQLN